MPQPPTAVRAGALVALGAFCVACINTFRKFTVATSIVPTGVFASYLIVGSAAWLCLLAAIYRGHNWARIVFIIAATLAVLSIPFGWRAASVLDHVTLAVNGTQTFANVVAAVLLMLPQSRRWFRMR